MMTEFFDAALVLVAFVSIIVSRSAITLEPRWLRNILMVPILNLGGLAVLIVLAVPLMIVDGVARMFGRRIGILERFRQDRPAVQQQ